MDKHPIFDISNTLSSFVFMHPPTTNIWDEPLEFRPERFLNEHAEFDVRGQNFEFIPFGSGRRMCPGPGVTFALQILHIVLARLLHGFEFGTVSDEPVDMTEIPAMTLPKATPLVVTVTPRLSSNILYNNTGSGEK